MNSVKIDINLAIEDIFKIVTVLMVIHILFFCIDGVGDFLEENVIKRQIYCMIGIIVYHFIIKKIVKNTAKN